MTLTHGWLDFHLKLSYLKALFKFLLGIFSRSIPVESRETTLNDKTNWNDWISMLCYDAKWFESMSGNGERAIKTTESRK